MIWWGRKFRFPKGRIVAFDKGYVGYEWYVSLTHHGVSLVTHLRTKAVYRVLERAHYWALKECNFDSHMDCNDRLFTCFIYTLLRESRLDCSANNAGAAGQRI